MAWKNTLDKMTTNKDKGEAKRDGLPLGYVVKKEPKTARRTFAMQYSLLDALQQIADESGTNLNALVHDVLTEYVNNYFKKGKKK